MQIVNLTRVVDLRHTVDVSGALDQRFGRGAWVYVGWEQPRLGLPRSPLANPFTCRARHHSHRTFVPTREEAVESFRWWVWASIQAGEEEVLRALRSLSEEQVLVCWCAPKLCHASVIERAARWVRVQGTTPGETSYHVAPHAAVVRESRPLVADLVLFDLDAGYLKVATRGGTRCFRLDDLVWQAGDQTPAVVREQGRIRHTTTGTIMRWLYGPAPAQVRGLLPAPQLSAPEADTLEVETTGPQAGALSPVDSSISAIESLLSQLSPREPSLPRRLPPLPEAPGHGTEETLPTPHLPLDKPFHPVIEAAREKARLSSGVVRRVRCVAELEEEVMPTELLLLADGAVLDVCYPDGHDAPPGFARAYRGGGMVDMAAVAQRVAAGRSEAVGALTYRPSHFGSA